MPALVSGQFWRSQTTPRRRPSEVVSPAADNRTPLVVGSGTHQGRLPGERAYDALSIGRPDARLEAAGAPSTLRWCSMTMGSPSWRGSAAASSCAPADMRGSTSSAAAQASTAVWPRCPAGGLRPERPPWVLHQLRHPSFVRATGGRLPPFPGGSADRPAVGRGHYRRARQQGQHSRGWFRLGREHGDRVGRRLTQTRGSGYSAPARRTAPAAPMATASAGAVGPVRAAASAAQGGGLGGAGLAIGPHGSASPRARPTACSRHGAAPARGSS